MTNPVPMFPLGSVVLPGSFLPLHVFEHRYRRLVADCLAGDRCFGITLISRGIEVGGGDDRTSVGVLARIEEAVEFDDGRWAIGALALDRIRVRRWLIDDPYPLAEIERWEDLPVWSPEDGQLRRVAELLTEVSTMAVALDEPHRPLPERLPEDPSALTHVLVACSPLGETDRFDLLGAESPQERLSQLEQRLGDQRVLYGARIAMGTG